jgi:hypothetical protein
VIHKQFEQISREDIESLVRNEVKEGRTIEYKQALPTNADKEKKEFLADVSSFANAAGGDLLFGVVEQRDSENKTTGIPESVPGLAGINTDQETRRLDSMLQAGIGPRIAGIRIRPVVGFPDGPVLLVRIPKSYAAPHMVTFQEHSRFYSRNNGGKYPLDVGEIRSAFALSESLPERVRRFRDERLARIVAGETPQQLEEGSKVVLHIVPVSGITSPAAIDIHRLCDQFGGLPLSCIDQSPHSFRFNFDGVLSLGVRSRDLSGPVFAYAQAFRNGAAEFVDAWTLDNSGPGQVLPETSVEKTLIRGLRAYLRIMGGLGVTPPLVVLPSLLGIQGCRIVRQLTLAQAPPIDRNDLLLPDVLVEDEGADAAQLLRPAFDALWQAAGWRGSQNYDKQGRWVER